MHRQAQSNWNFLFKAWSVAFRRRNGGDPIVRSIDSPRRSPATLIEQRLASLLQEASAISAADLVKRTAADLYEAELSSGAAAVDIGLLGERLFDRDIVRELYAGDGILWDITRTRENS